MTFFDAYKEYIVRHPERKEFIPTSDRFDVKALQQIPLDLTGDVPPMTQKDREAITHFIAASVFLRDIYAAMYGHIWNMLPLFQMTGKELGEYMVGVMNRNHHIVLHKIRDKMRSVNTEVVDISDLEDLRINWGDEHQSPLTTKGSLEIMADFTCLLLNYLRYFQEPCSRESNDGGTDFIGALQSVMRSANIGCLFRTQYNRVLYEGGRVTSADKGRRIVFTYDDEDRERLIKAGEVMLSNQMMAAYGKIHADDIKSRFYPWFTTFRIKSCSVQNGCIRLTFGQGRINARDGVAKIMDAAIRAYYPFLDIAQQLPDLDGVSVGDVIAVYVTIQYIVQYVVENGHFGCGLFGKGDFAAIPVKVRKDDLVTYIARMLTLKRRAISQCVALFEATWEKPNNIWATPVYPVGDCYILPFYPVLNASSYYVIDRFLLRGGVSLDIRGKQFERYVCQRLSSSRCPYAVQCLPARVYGVKGNCEEIDVLIGLKNVVLVAEAKCTQYPMEPINYHDAWKRLVEGCVQVAGKAEFVRRHPEYFKELGDYAHKSVIPFVLTNYPVYTGCSHKGVYVLDFSSFLAYMSGDGMMSRREMGKDSDDVVRFSPLYQNEDEFSGHFERFLRINPLKQLFLGRIRMEDSVIYRNERVEWISRSPQYENDRRFNITAP